MLLQDRISYRYFQCIVVCLLPCLLTVGCIAIPVPTGEEPNFAFAIPSLEVGITSKNQVLTEFGTPAITYNQDSEFIYVETWESWKIYWSQGSYGGSGVDPLYKRHVLLISFDEHGVLSNYKVETAGDDFGDCTRSGVCFGESNSVMRYTDAATNALAKTFFIVEDQCSIYLYGLGNKKAYEASLNGSIPVNVFSTDAFIHWETTPGRQSIVIHPDTTVLDFDCMGGEMMFVHFDYRWTGPSKLQLEDQETGLEHISKLRLVLLPKR